VRRESRRGAKGTTSKILFLHERSLRRKRHGKRLTPEVISTHSKRYAEKNQETGRCSSLTAVYVESYQTSGAAHRIGLKGEVGS